MPERFTVVCIPCEALYKWLALYHMMPWQICGEIPLRVSDLRDVGERVTYVETETVQVLPLLSGHGWSNVVSDDLCLVEQVLDDEHDSCVPHTHTHTLRYWTLTWPAGTTPNYQRSNTAFVSRGATTAKSWGGPRFGSQHCGVCARPKAGLGVGCGRDPAVKVRGYRPRKIFENSDAKSCILVDYLLWNFLLFENYGQEVGGTNTLLGNQSPRVPTVVAPMYVFITAT